MLLIIKSKSHVKHMVILCCFTDIYWAELKCHISKCQIVDVLGQLFNDWSGLLCFILH